ELIAIDSSNPGLVPGAAGERRIARYVTEWLRARGFRCRRIGPSSRPSVLATHRGSGGGRSLMLNGHLDTVSLDSYEGGAGLHPVHDGANIYGRGAYDMKSGLAAMM